jgi:hypothetical protein
MPYDQFLAKRANELQSQVDVASTPLLAHVAPTGTLGGRSTGSLFDLDQFVPSRAAQDCVFRKTISIEVER